MMSLLNLVRYKNLMMVLLTLVLTQYTIRTNLLNEGGDVQFMVVTIAIICITAGGYVINDIFDVNTDRINRPKTRTIGVSISKKKGFSIYFIFTGLGVFCAAYAAYMTENRTYTLFFVGPIILLYWYSKSLKRIAIIGNLAVSLLTALPIGVVSIFALNTVANTGTNLSDASPRLFDSLPLVSSLGIYCLLAFCMTFIRELIKDIEDMNGDYALHMKTLPILIGTKRTKHLVLLLSSLLFVSILTLAKVVLHHGMTGLFWYTMLCVCVPFSWFIFKLYHSKKTKDFKLLSTLLKYILFFGIMSMLLLKL